RSLKERAGMEADCARAERLHVRRVEASANIAKQLDRVGQGRDLAWTNVREQERFLVTDLSACAGRLGMTDAWMCPIGLEATVSEKMWTAQAALFKYSTMNCSKLPVSMKKLGC